MRLRVVALLAVIAAAVAAPPTALAGELRGCGSISGYVIQRDPVTTTCGLARSATRDYIARLGQAQGRPDWVLGRSPKTRNVYRLYLRRYISTRTWNASTFVGRAGDARLVVKITATLY